MVLFHIWILAEMHTLARAETRVHVVDVALTIAIVFKNVTGKPGRVSQLTTSGLNPLLRPSSTSAMTP